MNIYIYIYNKYVGILENVSEVPICNVAYVLTNLITMKNVY